MLVSKLHSGTSNTKEVVPVHLDVPLFWKFHCATCSPACVILYHVTGSLKGPISNVKYKAIYSCIITIRSLSECDQIIYDLSHLTFNYFFEETILQLSSHFSLVLSTSRVMFQYDEGKKKNLSFPISGVLTSTRLSNFF